jgi:anti-sigma B factor antagonist
MTRPPAFKIVTERTGAIAYIALHGELDLATAPRLQAELEAIRDDAEELERIILDLRDLAFLDSTGLEVIVQLDAAGQREGFDVAVVRGPRAVERLFAVMQLDRRLRMVDDPNEA